MTTAITMSPATPFLQIPGDNDYAAEGNSTVHFGKPAPDHAFLRFEELGPGLTVSFNGAAFRVCA